ncbi:MAG: hypothetical protein RL148_1709 [Planctomycetota bacterium]|jgi:putative redox protein
MVPITITYDGDLSCSATHGPSASTITTDAPRDNQGLGRTFSPTDLVATALGSCVLTTMAIVARRNGIEIRGARVHVEKHMSDNPRRIARLPVVVTMPARLDDDNRKRLENAAELCPVKASLAPGVDTPVTFVWPA